MLTTCLAGSAGLAVAAAPAAAQDRSGAMLSPPSPFLGGVPFGTVSPQLLSLTIAPDDAAGRLSHQPCRCAKTRRDRARPGGGTLLWLGQLNLNAGYWDIFWPQVLQGAGLALLFVPLTTLAMATIARERMGYATSLFNLMRNIGGSIGIAVTGTLLARQRQAVGAMLGEHVTAHDPVTQSQSAQIKAGLIAAGADPVTATQRAYAVLHGMLVQQASMVSFVMLFRLLGVLFLVMLPMVLLMKRPARGAAPMAAHYRPVFRIDEFTNLRIVLSRVRQF